ncbi:MAG: tetratricopeptide repeat protein [Rikenellaceae bacterium]
MKKIVLSFVALMAIASVSAQSLKETMDAGVAAYSAKDFATAAVKLEKVIDDGMDDEAAASSVATAKKYLPKCFFMLGGAATKSGDFDTARINFTKAAEYAELYDDPATMNSARGWVGRTYELQGSKLFNDKKYAEALPIFENGYAEDSRNAKMANWLGICYCETGNFDSGMDVFAKVAAMGSNPKYAAEAEQAQKNIEVYTINRVAKLQESKNYNGIIDLANQMLSKDSSNGTAAKVRLQAYSDKKDFAKVFELAESAASIQTSAEEKSNIYFILAAAYNEKEMKDQAIATFKKVTAGPNAATAASTVAELTK